MKDELYIDGAKIELPEKGTGIVLNRAVGKPADISSILSGFSYTIQLPKTANNIQAFGFSTEINVDSDYPHVEHTAKVIRDGVILFDNGIAVIKSVIQTIDVLISWGTDERLTILNNTKLNTLDMGKVRWDYGISNSELDYVTWVAGLDGRENQMPEHLRPAIRVSTIFNTLIGSAYQINSEYQNLINKMWLMLPTTNGNKETVGDLSFRIKGNATLENIKSRLYPDVLPQIFFDSKYDLIYRIAGKPQYVNIPLGGRYKIYGRINTTVPVGQWLFGIYTLPEETITEEYTPDFDIFSTTFTFLIDQYIEIGAGNICFGITSEHDEGEFDIDFQLFFEPENEKDYSNTAFLLDYPIGPNLPDISALDFIKSIMGVFGLMVEKGRDRLNLFNVDDIIASKKDAIDISGMLIDKNDDKLEYTYGLTKTNILKYAEDDLINKEYGSYTFSADTYDKKENVVYQSPYAAMEKSIPLYSITENGWELNKTSKCRLLIEDGERTLKVLDKFMNPAKTLTFKSFTFDNLKYENLVKKYWQGYIGVFANTPRIAYRKAILPPNFLPNYSFNTPVYASGNYYMLLSIKNYSGTGKADIELALLDNIKFVSPTNLKNVLIERYESPIKFDIDTVALYTRTGEEPNNGKLIRELDNIPTSEDLSQTYIPLDKGTGAALKILLKNLPFLRKDIQDVALEVIKFLKGAEFGEFISSMITGTGARIDASGHAEFDSVAIRKWLETPELRYNRVTVVGSEFWVTDGAKFDTVTKAGNLFIVKMKLEEGEIIPLFVGDILKGIYYDKSTDGKVKGFRTLWFRVNAVDQASQTITVASRYPDDAKYNPVPFLEVARIGSFTDESRQRSILIDGKENCITFLDNVNTWDITPAMEVCWFGRKDRSIPGVPSTAGYNAKLSNIIMSGKIFQYDEISGNDYLVPIDKGSYIPGRKYAYYDRVSATGGLWLCVNENGTTSAPSEGSADWLLQVANGEKGDKGDTGDINLNHLDTDYSPYTAYKTGDVVPFNGGKIYCKKDNTGVTPVPFLKTGGKYLKTGNYYLLAVPLSASNLNKTYWEIFQDKPIVRATRWLTSNTSVIRFNTIGSPVPSTAIVQCKRQRDGFPVEDCADLWLTYRTYAETTYISQSTPVKTISVALGNFRADGIYYVRGYESEQDAKDWNGNFTTEYTITHANDGIGQAGDTGASPRMRGMWSGSISDYVWNSQWRDIVIRTVNGVNIQYAVKVKGTVPANIDPSSSAGATYWEQAQQFKFIATDLLLADKIKSDMINTNGLVVNSLKTTAAGVRIEIIPDGGNTRIKAINKNGETVMSIGFDSRDGEGNPKVQIRKDGKELTLFAGRMYVSGSSGRLLRIAESSTGKCVTISGLGGYDDVSSGEMYRMDNNLVGIKP